MIRYAPWVGWRALTRVSRHANAQSSSSSAFRINTSPTASESQEKNVEKMSTPITTVTETKSDMVVKIPVISQNSLSMKSNRNPIGLVAKTFGNSKMASGSKKENRKHAVSHSIDDLLKSAKTVESLLSIASTIRPSRQHCLTIVSTLADWTNEKRIELSSFDSDPRFLKICKQLGHGVGIVIPQSDKQSDQKPSGRGDLAMVLEVTGDDEASKLVSGIPLNQAIKVMSTLALHRRRSLPLLQSLASNLGRFNEVFNMKEGADVLYAMSVLNFPDDNLLERTCRDLCLSLKENKNSAVVRSIVTSLGHLRYKHLAILDDLSEWYAHNLSSCRPQDVAALLMTLAVLMHVPTNESQLFDIVTKELNARYMPTPAAWLDVVWALVVLNQATASNVQSVLEPEFQKKLLLSTGETKKLSVSMKRKLLNINASAKLLIPNYKGPFLEKESFSNEILMKRSREKQIFVTALFESLSNLLPSQVYLRRDVDMEMGFLLDGECIIDNKLNPLPLSDPTSPQKGKRIGIFAWNYDDMCRSTQPTPGGHASLAMRLSKASGYHILSVPFTEFNPQDKLITRVQYLEQQLKMIATLQ